MKLLIDQNISHRILAYLPASFSQSVHVRDERLINKDDYSVFMYARNHHFAAILTMDEDFNFLVALHKTPPKIIWLRTGNCSTRYLGNLIKQKEDDIIAFLKDKETDCLQVFM